LTLPLSQNLLMLSQYKNMRLIVVIAAVVVAGALLLSAPPLFAQTKLNSQQPINDPDAGPDGLLDIKAEAGNVLNQIKADTSGTDRLLGIPQIVGRIMGQVMLVLGSVALMIFVYAGVRWMLAVGRGQGEAAATAQRIIIWAVIGLIVIFTSYIAMTYVIKLLYSAAA